VEAAPNPVKLLETEAKAALEQRLTKQITADYGGQIDEKDLLDCVHSLRYAKTTTGETRVFGQDRLVFTRKNDPLPRQARDTYTRGTKIKLKGPVCVSFLQRPRVHKPGRAAAGSSRGHRCGSQAALRYGWNEREKRERTEFCYVVSCRVCPELVMAKPFATIKLIDRVCECFVINDDY
jgi:hypothetical protein